MNRFCYYSESLLSILFSVSILIIHFSITLANIGIYPGFPRNKFLENYMSFLESFTDLYVQHYLLIIV